ncbi:unannotated protein [freshwater metagenome]|uniref:Unannotated protein n=1 Tax=freshwater metagenome TaxID=449393 RepID=A0A6J7JGJ4_9ZZZZ
MIAPRTFEMVVLAVNVGGNGPANGDIASARSDGNEQALRHQSVQESIDACAGIGSNEHGVGGRIRCMNRERSNVGGFDDGAASVLRRVSVAAAKTASDQTSFKRGGKRSLQLNR